MIRNYNLRHRLIACTLLLNLFLQSCSNSMALSSDGEKREQGYDTNVFVSEEPGEESQYLFSRQQGQQMTIYQQAGED